MKSFILISIFSVLSIYGIVLYNTLKKKQSATVYWVFLTIQIIILICFLLAINNPQGADLMGRAMAQGFAVILYIVLQVFMTILVLLFFVLRRRNFSNSSIIGIIVLMVAAIYILLFVDLKGLFLSLKGINENKLVLQNEIMYTPKNKEFTGTAVFKGYTIEYRPEIIPETEKIDERYKTKNEYEYESIRVTHYKNGMKEGTEKVYFTSRNIIGKGHTYLYCVSEYSEGHKHGEEKIYHNDGSLAFETSYANGKLHGLCREYYPVYVNGNPLLKEAEYSHGEISGFYRTFDIGGNPQESYIFTDNCVAEGCRWLKDAKHTLEWYEDGQLIIKRVFDCAPNRDYRNFDKEEYLIHPIRTPQKAVDGIISVSEIFNYRHPEGLFSESYYENGVLVEYIEFEPDTGKATIYKKRIKGKLIKINTPW